MKIKRKDYTMPYLYEKLEEAGLPCSRGTIRLWMKSGKLKLRRRPHNNWKVINAKEAEEIVRAFSPGGKGKWEHK